MPMLELGPWAPDQPNARNAGLELAQSVLPSERGYSSLPTLQSVGAGSLSDKCRGAMTGRSRSGLNFTVGGTVDALHIATTTGLSDVSGAFYTLTPLDWWSFALYGNRVIGSSYADEPQSFVIGTSATFSPLSADAPRARHLAIVRDFLVAGNIIGRGVNATDIGTAEDGVQWSAIDNPTLWPQVGTAAAKAVQSDWQPLAGNGGEVTGVVGGSDYGLIFRKSAIWRMDYEGGDTFFRFTPIDEQRGCATPKSAIRVGGIVYFHSDDGFFATDGWSPAVPIGNGIVDEFFRSELQPDSEPFLSCAFFPRWKCIGWLFMGSEATNQTPNTLLLFNPIDNRWAFARVAAEWLVPVMPFTQSLDAFFDDMDTGVLAAVNLDTLIAASVATPGAFDTTHTLASFTAPAGVAVVQTADYEPAPGRVGTLLGVRPVFDSGPSALTVQSIGRLRPSDIGVYSAATEEEADGRHPQRVSGRYLASRFTLSGDFAGFHGFDADVAVRGRR